MVTVNLNTKSEVAKFYDRWAVKYTLRDEGYRKQYFNGIEFSLLEMLDIGEFDVLDVGTGTGRVPLYLSGCCRSVVACDFSFEMVRVSSERCAKFSNIRLFQADAEQLPLSNSSFHLITCFGLFEYVSRLDPHLMEFFRLLHPGGYLIFSVHNGEAWSRSVSPGYDITFHNWSDMEQMLRRNGFEVIAHKTGFHLPGRWVMFFAKLVKPFGLSSYLIKFILSASKILEQTQWSQWRGRTIIVLAQKLPCG